MRRKRYWGVVVLLLLPALKALSQAPVSPKVELFAGAELHYRDIFYTKMYEVFPDYAGENHLEMTAGFLFPAE